MTNNEKLLEKINSCENPRMMLAALAIVLGAVKGVPTDQVKAAIDSVLKGGGDKA